MRYTSHDTGEENLRKENEDLRRQLRELQSPAPHLEHPGEHPGKLWRPSSLTIWAIFLTVVILTAVAFLAGYIPLRNQNQLIETEARDQERALPRVAVVQVGRSSSETLLQLPGSIQAVTEAPLLARADGYVLRRSADIGDRVTAGQTLLVIEALEMDEQIHQAEAGLQQAQAALAQANATSQQGESDRELAHVTADRWSALSGKGIVSKQENDQYQAQYRSKIATAQALQKAIDAQRSAVASSAATLARLKRMQGYLTVTAPFSGVVTQRNVDVGTLVNAGSTLLFRVAQTGMLRTFVNVPQTHANSVHPGQLAQLSVSNVPGRRFPGKVARTANALDAANRTLLVEVEVPNRSGLLLPGMYAQVDLSSERANPPLMVPSDALVMQSGGSTVAVVRPDHTIHLQKIEVGRDYGDRLEVVAGLHEGDTVIPNPGDLAREGLKVDPLPAAPPSK